MKKESKLEPWYHRQQSLRRSSTGRIRLPLKTLGLPEPLAVLSYAWPAPISCCTCMNDVSVHILHTRIHERWTNKSQTPVGRFTKRDFWQQIRVKKTGIVKPQPAKNFNWSNPLANSTSKGGNTPGRLGKKPTRRESKVLSGVFLRL